MELVQPFVVELRILIVCSFWVQERLHNGRQDGIPRASIIAIPDLDNCILLAEELGEFHVGPPKRPILEDFEDQVPDVLDYQARAEAHKTRIA